MKVTSVVVRSSSMETNVETKNHEPLILQITLKLKSQTVKKLNKGVLGRLKLIWQPANVPAASSAKSIYKGRILNMKHESFWHFWHCSFAAFFRLNKLYMRYRRSPHKLTSQFSICAERSRQELMKPYWTQHWKVSCGKNMFDLETTPKNVVLRKTVTKVILKKICQEKRTQCKVDMHDVIDKVKRSLLISETTNLRDQYIMKNLGVIT